MEDAETKAAWNMTLRFLGYRNRSEYEIFSYLKKKGFSSLIINNVTTKLKERGFINDRQFALDWINYSNKKGRGIYRIVMELKEKGVSDSIIEESKDSLFSDEDEYNKGLQVAERYLPSQYGRDDQKLIRKTAAFLKRRGFKSEIVYRIIGVCFKNKTDYYND